MYNIHVYPPPRPQFATNLVALRKKKGISQRDLANGSGLSQRMISYYESHDMIPPMDKLQRLAAALQVSIGELVDPALIPKSALELTTRTIKKIQIIEQLPPEDQRKVMSYAQDLLEKNLFRNAQTTPTPMDKNIPQQQEAAESSPPNLK